MKIKKKNNSDKNRIFGKLLQVLLCMFLLAVMAGCGKSSGDDAGGQAATCTVSIKCGTILESMDNFNPDKKDFVPEDGVILPETVVEIKDGDTVYDILRTACRDNNILMESRNTTGMAYVEGIAQLYEFDGGELSGWMYKVNGVFPEYGSDSLKAQDGDQIEWLYTMSLGSDIGDEHDPES